MSESALPADTPLARLRRLVESTAFQRFVTTIILINAVTLGLETSPTAMEVAGFWLVLLDKTILTVFVFELLAKMVVYRWSFFRNGWNVFDFLIVGISLVPATGNLSILRALRILRVLRLLSVVPQMRSVIQALLAAIPGMMSIIAVLFLVFYVASVLATKLFGQAADPSLQEWFGTIGASMYSLFQIMTLESWSMGIVRPTMEHFPWAWAFFVPFIVLTSFAVLNLFIAIIVNAMQSQHTAEVEAEQQALRTITHDEMEGLGRQIAALHSEVAELRRLLQSR